MESDSAEAKKNHHHSMCNGEDTNKKASSLRSCSEEQDLDLDLMGEGGEGGEGDKLLVKEKKKAASAKRKVRFNDCSLTQVLEFQPSNREDAISLCAQLCTWLCGQRTATDT